MDFNADGTPDIISGSWPGELYFFAGQGKGRFAASKKIFDSAGKAINPGSASTVCATDWEGDGDLDLLLGNIDGQLLLSVNRAAGGKASFAKSTRLSAAGKPIGFEGGDSHPVVADWDADGLSDVIVGLGDGSVRWLRNAGTRQAPKLETARTLVPASEQHAMMYGSSKPTSTARGIRAKVCAADFNSDGVLDLLVGDFSMRPLKSVKLTPTQQAEQDRAERRLQTLMKKLEPYFAEMNKIGSPRQGASAASWQKKMNRLNAKYAGPLKEMEKLYTVTARYQPETTQDGFVWLLTASRQAAKSAAK